MCGRFTMHTPAQSVLSHFNLPSDDHVQLTLRFNIAPTQRVPVVRATEAGDRELMEMRWGLVPFWSKDPGKNPPLINARSETAATKPTFRAAFKQRRCLVPADGYFEWLRSGKKKIPQYIRMDDERLFAFAGLWERWGKVEEGNVVHSFAILTTAANELTSPIHERMPVILDEANYEVWLDPDLEDRDVLQPLMKSYSSEEMKFEPVSTRVNNARNDDPACLEVQQELF